MTCCRSPNGSRRRCATLLFTEIDAYDFSHGQFEMTGPDVMLTPKAFSAMALVCHELVTNASKHGALTTPAGKITVETAADAIGNVTVAWRESGGPPVAMPTRRGFGTTILEQVIPFEVDGTSTPRFSPGGFVLDVLLPASAAECFSGSPAREPAAPATEPGGTASYARLLDTTLIVEDNLFIALDAEDMLRKLGAVRVDIAKSVAEALALANKAAYSFALLDVNLGAENSLPVARLLLAKDTPFVFGTGYGEVAFGWTRPLASIPTVSKPYHPANFAHVLSRLVAGTARGPAHDGGGLPAIRCAVAAMRTEHGPRRFHAAHRRLAGPIRRRCIE